MTTKTADVYVCIDGHSGPHGVFARGARLRGDHPAIAQAPALWAVDGTSDQELHAQRAKQYDPIFEQAEAAQREKERRLARLKGPIVRATTTFEVDPAALPGLPAWAVVTVREGSQLLASEEVARRHADRFEPVPFED